MDPAEISKYGFKAASLLYLKGQGLFPKKLLVLNSLPSLKDFKTLLKNTGLEDVPFGIRFSPRTPQLCIKSKHQITNVKEGYSFLKEYSHQGAAIIQEYTDPSMMGTLYFDKNIILINLVPGTWASSACDSCDIIEIGENITYHRYTKNRYALYAGKNGFEPRIAAPFSQAQIEKLIAMFRHLLPKLAIIKKGRMMIEFIVDDEYNFLAMEIKESSVAITSFEQHPLPNLFEVKEFSDIAHWDKKKDLLISIKLGRNHPPEFFAMINEIKKHKSMVYIKYGLLSHPAIVLREYGIATEQYNEGYEQLTFSL